MTTKYTKIKSRTGGPSIGTIACVPKTANYNYSSNESTESSRWAISTANTKTYGSNAFFPGWFECDGRSLNAASYPMLFRVIGNTYGGSGLEQSGGSFSGSFNLPDYRGKKLVGTGRVDSNRGSSGSAVTDSGPGTGGGAGGPNEAGSTGGTYEVNVTRFSAADSEVTPGAPTGSKVVYLTTDSWVSSNDNGSGVVTNRSWGTGIGETGGFPQPSFDTIGSNYVSFSSSSSSLNSNRSWYINNRNLTGYDKLFVTAIAGNDNNGGERPNNGGERLRVNFSFNGSTVSSDITVIPAVGDSSLNTSAWDDVYTAWREIVIDIPVQYRTSGVRITFSQTIVGSNEWNSATVALYGSDAAVPDDFSDAYGISRIGLLGGVFDPDAADGFNDTFSIGTKRTSGFDQIFEVVDPNFTGNITFSAGNASTGTSTRGIFSPPAHSHFVAGCSVSGGNVYEEFDASKRDEDGRVALLNNSVCSIMPYTRSGRGIRTHSHLIAWGFPQTAIATYGHDNGSGSSGIVNADVRNTGSLSEVSYGEDESGDYDSTNEVGNQIFKTLDVVEDLGVSVNISEFSMRENSRRNFDDALDIYFESGEGFDMATQYTRLKYIIRAW
jgi:hypothetical protein